uniref:Phage minor tail protein n=1 Tax=Escherichia coli TaxID=562 RepID=A0A7U1E1J6_ECOLX|nr:hypothetical protein [Escherichia coli]QQZ47168.1 Phage minor tail protein [Escherichia coli]
MLIINPLHEIKIAAIYALGEGRCQADNIIRELERLSQTSV